jgi:hypothetical protein
LKSMSLVVQSGKSDANAKSDAANAFSQGILIEAKKAAAKVRIAIEEKDPAVMGIELNVTTAKDSFSLVMSAELKCPGPNGKVVTVWKNSKPILTGDPQKMRMTPVLLKLVKDNTDNFFNSFVRDVRQARAKMKAGK